MHTHETLVLHRHHRSISTRDKKKEKKRKEKKSSYNSSINKVRRFRFETKVPIVSTLRAETWRSLPFPSLPRNHETVHDPMTPPRSFVSLTFTSRFCIFDRRPWLDCFENSARFFLSFFFFIRPSFRSTRIRRSRITRVSSFYFSANVVEKRKGSVPSRARVDRSIVDRAFERSPLESPIIERSSRMQKGLQPGWGWREEGGDNYATFERSIWKMTSLVTDNEYWWMWWMREKS